MITSWLAFAGLVNVKGSAEVSVDTTPFLIISITSLKAALTRVTVVPFTLTAAKAAAFANSIPAIVCIFCPLKT